MNTLLFHVRGFMALVLFLVGFFAVPATIGAFITFAVYAVKVVAS